jgi:hypothetical protein
MTPVELEYLSKAFLDISAFDYKNEPVFDRKYFKAKYPGFSEVHSPSPATTTRNRWATREDPLHSFPPHIPHLDMTLLRHPQ